MPTALAIAICLLYFVGVLVGAPWFGPAMTAWFLAGWSAAFVWGYFTFARGRRITALSIVAIVTVLLPVFALIALVWPIYGSPPAIVTSLWFELRARGPLGNLELFMPLVAAAIVASLVGKR